MLGGRQKVGSMLALGVRDAIEDLEHIRGGPRGLLEVGQNLVLMDSSRIAPVNRVRSSCGSLPKSRRKPAIICLSLPTEHHRLLAPVPSSTAKIRRHHRGFVPTRGCCPAPTRSRSRPGGREVHHDERVELPLRRGNVATVLLVGGAAGGTVPSCSRSMTSWTTGVVLGACSHL